MLFRPKPGLSDNNKARIEFNLQTLAECIGLEAMQLPFLIPEESLAQHLQPLTLEPILTKLGQHLRYDVGPVKIRIEPQQLNKCGGGG